MWVEINGENTPRAQAPPVNIEPEPTVELETRVVVWRTKEIPNMDIEGCSDIQVKTYYDTAAAGYSDTHWRCQNGNASFNYRVKLSNNSKQPNTELRVEAWDRDIIKSNDIIGGCNLNLAAMMKDVLMTGKKSVLHEVYFEEFLRHEMLKVGNSVANQITFEDKEKFWVPCLYEEPDTGNINTRGEILISIHMLTKEEAE